VAIEVSELKAKGIAMTQTRKGRARHVTRRLIGMATAGTATAALGAFAFAPAANAVQPSFGGSPHGVPAVFVQTNDATGNSVIAYARANDGSLHETGEFATGGLGGSEAGAVVDPLASQGSLTYDANDHLLFVVNAGSDTFTVFDVDGAYLHRTQILSSNGHLPTSIGVSGNLMYVLDAGNAGAISGYRIDGRFVHPIANSTRSLGLGNPADPNFLMSPSQVAISPDLRDVAVGTKTNGVLDVFTLTHNGVPSTAPVTTTSAGGVPFALGFDPIGRLLVAEASGGASSYWVNPDGSLTTISAHIANGQTATCWGAAAKGYIYVANAGSNTISAYVENWRGQLSLLNGADVIATTDAGPVDMATTSDGRYLYQEATGAGVIDEFKVGDNGSLTLIGTVTGFTPDNGTGFEGIAAT
jgi:6-phosphogluconolactonase (cycloisomerase 2 family)